LREAPRLWYLKVKQCIIDAGFQELRTGKGAFVVRFPDGSVSGMMVLHVDDACFAGEGKPFDNAIAELMSKLTIGQEDKWEF